MRNDTDYYIINSLVPTMPDYSISFSILSKMANFIRPQNASRRVGINSKSGISRIQVLRIRNTEYTDRNGITRNLNFIVSSLVR